MRFTPMAEALRSEFLGTFRPAIRLCAEDAAVPADAIRALGSMEGWASRLVLMGAGRDPDAARYVVKTERTHVPTRWAPDNEMAGLSFVAARVRVRGFGAIEPIGYGMEPRFLVTRYQPGTSVCPIFHAALLGFRRGRHFELACELAEAMALWLAALRDAEVRDGEGLSIEDYLASCRARIEEIARLDATASSLARKVERLAANISTADRQHLGCAYPYHGDLLPHNLLRDASGVLYTLDLDGFGFGPLDHDLAAARMCFEQFREAGVFGGWRHLAIWQRFLDMYLAAGSSPAFALLCYLHGLLARMAKPMWRPPVVTSSMWQLARRMCFLTRWRLHYRPWLRGRIAWLRDLPAELERAEEYFRARL